MKPSRASKTSRPDEHGFAIILTLIVITMMTVLVIGFNAATRTEQMAARNFSQQEQANQMAMLAINRAVGLLNSAVTNSNVVTQPGRYYSPASGVQPLTSANTNCAAPASIGAMTTNINIWQQYGTNAYTNYFISTNTDPAAFTVPLVDVKNGTTNIGRYGFWIDDDGSRLNLNAAWTNTKDFLPTNARPLVLSTNVFPAIPRANFGAAITNFTLWVTNTSANNVGFGYFFTPRQAAGLWMPTSRTGTTTTYRCFNPMMFQIGSGPVNFRMSNSYALSSSNGVGAALDVTNTNGFLAEYGSAGYAGSLNALNAAIDAVSGKFFRGTNYATYFGKANGFAEKYGTNGMRQIIANINDAAITGGNNSTFTGANTNDMLATSGGGTNPVIPSTVLGLRPAIFLNEVAVGVAYATNGGAARPLELQVFMKSEMVDPYRSGLGGTYEILYGLKSLEFSGTYQAGGKTITFTNNTNTTDVKVREGVVQGLSGMGTDFKTIPKLFCVPTNAYGFEYQNFNATDPELPPTASNIVINSMTVRPSYAVIRARQGTPTTVRDWAAFADFPSNGFKFNNPPLVAKAIGYGKSGEIPEPNSLFTQSIEKNDPRVRRFGTNTMPSPAWTFVSTPTLGANNSSVNFTNGTGIAGVGNDRVGTLTNIYDHPSFPTNADPNNATNITLGRSNWISAFDLSKIHTGLQWRTLQFRAQDAAESAAGHVPDWALLEVFAVTNPAVASPANAFKLNINSLAYPAGSSISAATLLTSDLARPQALASLLEGMTKTNATNAQIGTNNLGFPAAAGFANANDYLLAATNIASMKFTNTWSARRAANSKYQTNLYSLPAEVLEVDKVSNFSTDEKANEARAQAIYTGVSVASQTFTVYAAGFATDKQGIDTAEVRVRAQVTRDTNTGKFKIIFIEPLIWD